jgi:hypothetical protein
MDSPIRADTDDRTGAGPAPAAGTESPPDVEDVAPFPATAGWLRTVDLIALGALGLVAIVVRFSTKSPMWLDEALTVHIAQQPLGQIPHALRHDGHPPLYYFMLHGWMSVFGTSNVAIRSLPGVFGVLLLPATWFAGRRLGGRTVAWCTVVLLALLPYAVRYSTENRMYSLVMLLAVVGWLLVDSALRRPRPLLLVGIVACTSALLWSHYWAMWLGLAAVLLVGFHMVRAWREHRRDDARAAALVIGALAVGAATFLPWLSTLRYQNAHTGTPWGNRSLPPSVIVSSIEELGGAVNATDALAGWIFAFAILLGLFATGVASGRLVLDLRTQPRARRMAWICLLTMGFGSAVMLATNSAFQSRYNAVWIPFAFLIAGIGLAQVRGPLVKRGALALVVLAGVPGVASNITLARTQAGISAAAIARDGRPGDVVALCPDQLGPSLMRVLPKGFVVGSYPTFSDPHTVDWVDYVARTNAATPEQFANQVLAKAGPNHRIFLVWMGTYVTHKGLCERVVNGIQRHRPDAKSIVTADRGYYEAENVMEFGPTGSS